ncbi:hypothetical protein [Amycolatopsis thermophila]|uniref:Membrane protein YagU involved in acid resistance n=1 Tax=Amycolatopsis thermophila TaxID=206084 RepID=A0ABU0F1I3_9PSEU|nr:hypothetical protein [Amycolatopsis thermophila]MDQ0381439.1 putative membrane protein YagU involved in acid resistance [Amycolatopsis thermophila]
MSTTAHLSGTSARLANGAIAGLTGGVVFGVLMAMMGMLPMIGMLIGVDNAVVGFVVHLVNSAVIGVIFAVLVWPLAGRIGPLLGAGVVYGVVWWVLGALVIMPLWLSVTADPIMRGMVFHIGKDQWLSLMGHVLYGLVTAGALYGLRRRATS